MKQNQKANLKVNMGKVYPNASKSTCLRINLEASFTPVIQNNLQTAIENPNVYARELASPVLYINKDYKKSSTSKVPYNSSANTSKKGRSKSKKNKKRRTHNTKRNQYNKISRSKSVNNNQRRLENRINFYKVQHICNHFHKASVRRKEFNNTPVHKKSHSINEVVTKGVAPVPSRTVRPADILETRPSGKNKKRGTSALCDKSMNSNRVIEPFSPTFDRPEGFVASNQTSFRFGSSRGGKLVKSKYSKKSKEELKDRALAPSIIFNETEKIQLNASKIISSQNELSHSDTIDFEKLKKIATKEKFKETGKFVNPLSDSSEATSKTRPKTKRRSKDTSRKARRHKSCHGRQTRRKTSNNKSEERCDKTLHPEQSKYPKENTSSAEKYKRSVISPHTKINKLIRESLK